jgi:hypothetical protein
LISGVALASTLHVSPEQMAECWEAFSMNKNVSELTDHTFQPYRTQLIKASEKAVGLSTDVGAVQSRNVKRESTNMVTPPAAKRQQNGDGPSSVDSVARSDVSSPKRPSVVLPQYNQRTRVGEVVASYHPAGLPPMTKEGARNSRRCVISSEEFNNVKKPYRHMFTTIEERATALEKQLTTLGNEIVETYGISDGENGIAPLEQVNVPRQEKICCVGRICNEVSAMDSSCRITKRERLTHTGTYSRLTKDD